MQASRKCTFAPLAGAKAPNPYAAFGREVVRPQAAERKRMAEKCEICLRLNPEKRKQLETDTKRYRLNKST